MNDHTLRRIFVFFLVIFGVLGVIAVFAVRNINRSVASNDWVNHTHAVISEVEGVLSTLRAGDGATRTYLMTGDRRDLAAAREALAIMGEHVEVAKALTRNEQVTHQQVLRLEALVNQRGDFAEEIAAARNANQPGVVQNLLAADTGIEALGEVRRVVGKIKADQMALLAGRDREAYLQAQTTRWIVGTGVAFNFILFGVVTWLIRDDLATRRRLATTLQETNDQLEAKVLERTTELAASNERLVNENLEGRWTNQALEHQLRYNQLIVDSVKDLVFVLTKAMNITRINPAVVHLTGWDPKELLGGPLAKVVRSAEIDDAAGGHLPVHPILQAMREGHELPNHAAIIEDHRGRKIPAYFTLFPLRDRDKVVGGILVVHTPMTPIAGVVSRVTPS